MSPVQALEPTLSDEKSCEFKIRYRVKSNADMTASHPLTQFQIWPGHGKMTDPTNTHTISKLAWMWKDDWPPTHTHTISKLAWTWKDDWYLLHLHTHTQFQIWPGHEKMTKPPPLHKRHSTCEGNFLVFFFAHQINRIALCLKRH